jgi:flagellar hook-associated protein 3 FlgL
MIDTDASNSSLTAALQGNNDPTGSGRNTLGEELNQLADSIIQSMNTRYGDDFLFSGTDGLNVPFTWSDDGTQLLYRGVNVSALSADQVTALQQAGVTVTEDGSDYEKLTALAAETNYVDVGLGLQLDDSGKTISSSAFNDSLNGINYLGSGTDEEFNRLINKLEDASSNMKINLTQLDTKAAFLERNSATLETTADTLNNQFLDIEQCELADAITSYSWAQYCYNAALKVGNSILSQSLIDYMD